MDKKAEGLPTVRKLLLAAVFMMTACLSTLADGVSKSVILSTAGTLSDNITDEEKTTITSLKISGSINGTDVKFLREMAGRDVNGQPTSGNLSILDLSEAKIVEGGDSYFYDDYTKNNVLGDCAFKYCSGLTSLTIPSSVTEIGDNAFSGCSGLTNFTIPDGVTEIGYCAFADCSGLTSLTIPSSVTEIGDNAFFGCSGLTSFTIPSSVTEIGESAFTDCSALTSVYVSWLTPIAANKFAFDGVDKNCTLYVPQGTLQDYTRMKVWSNFKNIVEYDVTGIDTVAFSADAKEVSRFSTNGQQLAAPTNGLNIVRYSDGSVRKVVVR